MLITRFDTSTISQALRDAGWHVCDGETKRPRVPSPQASLAKPNQCRPFLECVRFAETRGWGIGLQMASIRGLVGIDLDNCLPLDSWADEIIERAESATYLSASGTGIHIVVGGRWPLAVGKEWAHPDGQEHHGFGVYPGGITRFLTVGPPYGVGSTFTVNQPFLDWLVGKYFPRTPATIVHSTRLEEIEQITAYYYRCFPDTGVVPFLQESKTRWGRLWKGDWGDDYMSQSEADLALATHLCFEYVGPDPQRLETLMTISGLGQREKWQNREDYRDRTIEKAIHGYLASPVFVADLVRARRSSK